MSHSLQGKILAVGETEIDFANVRSSVSELLRSIYPAFNCFYDKREGWTKFSKGDGRLLCREQPFIDVPDELVGLWQWGNLDLETLPDYLKGKDLFLVAEVSSGSHASFCDSKLAREVLSATKGLYDSLKLDGEISYIFDDERQIYTPEQFRGELDKTEKILSGSRINN
ncbi:MAG: hypothetical protein ABIH72_05860 [archaeon]